MLSLDKLKIELSSLDMNELRISYDELDYTKPQTKKIVLELLNKAKCQTGFEVASKKLFIEVFPRDDGGCIFYISVMKESDPAKKYKIKNILAKPMIFSFEDAEAMINACCRLNASGEHRIVKSILYAVEAGYCLVVYPLSRKDPKVRCVLTEYGNFLGEIECYDYFLLEHADLVLEEDAVETIARSLN